MSLAPGAHVSSAVTVSFGGTPVAELIDFGHDGMKAGAVETTNQASPQTNNLIYETFEPDGVVDSGDISLKVQITGALPAVGTVGNVVVTHPVQGSWTYDNCIMIGFSESWPFKGRMTGTIKFKCSGAPSFAGAGG